MHTSFTTPLGVEITRDTTTSSADSAYEYLRENLNVRQGILLSCRVTFPGRYRPHWIGFVNPPVKIKLRAGRLSAAALNPRGSVIIHALHSALRKKTTISNGKQGTGWPELLWNLDIELFDEINAITKLLGNSSESHWGMYGAFGYDIALREYGIAKRLPRSEEQDDMVLFIPDQVIVCEHPWSRTAEILDYNFAFGAQDTARLPREILAESRPQPRLLTAEEPQPGSYERLVENAVEACRKGELFEVVGSQCFRRATSHSPRRIFDNLEEINPSPYGFFANFGNEHLIGASPEMFVRVTGKKVESCPISGTVARGKNAMEDADQILDLLNSRKAEAELTMATDLDIDDKAAVCEPGSVSVIGRRQIEIYSHLLHTVDHVSGTLKDECSGLDAFRAHLWAVTLTGAPRRNSLEFIENNETTPRCWYGGAVGRIGFDGTMDTGIVLRALRLQGGVAEIRVGASLLHSSDPEEEGRETLTKAAAMFEAISRGPKPREMAPISGSSASRRPVLIVDLGGPFINTLAAQLTYAAWLPQIVDGSQCHDIDWQGRVAIICPALDDGALETSRALVGKIVEAKGALLGIGHGMLAVAEYFGARSTIPKDPSHGDRRRVIGVDEGRFFAGTGDIPFWGGAYYRRVLDRTSLSRELACIFADEDGAVVAIEHKSLPVAGILVQPQSILSSDPQLVPKALDSLI